MTETRFADYLRIVGKGPNMSRPLDQDEARDAARQIFSGKASPMQIGALLLLMRYREETAAEIAGLIEGAQSAFVDDRPDGAKINTSSTPDIDWPSYADRHRQQPWFILSALLLSKNGSRVLMHGVKGGGLPYAANRPVLEQLGIELSTSLQGAANQMDQTGFAYIGIEHFCPVVEELCDIRDELGVRTVINTLARGLNPLGAPNQLIGVAHPPYKLAHADVSRLLNQPRTIVLKGGGGEAQRNPFKPCRVMSVSDGSVSEDDWLPMIEAKGYNWRTEDLDPKRVAALWHGEDDNLAAATAVIGTAALVLHQMGKASSFAKADAMATDMWHARNT
jgi:anthranilate phosphoribosyltransferase